MKFREHSLVIFLLCVNLLFISYIAGTDYMFPTPQLENVYSAWKPLDHGHPLVDVTIHYAPPELERVHIGAGPVPNRPPTSAGNKWVDSVDIIPMQCVDI